MMKKTFILASAITLILAGSAYAASRELSSLIKAAKQEGQVSWTAVIREKEAKPFIKAFEKEYGIKVDYTRQHGGQAMERLMREFQTGLIAYDVVQIHPDSLEEFIELDAIVKVSWESLGVSKEFVHTGNRFVGPFEAPYTILYNNKLVKPEESPKNWEE